MLAGHASFPTHARPFFVLVLTLIVILAACGGDDEAPDDIATAPDPTPEAQPAETSTPEPEPTPTTQDDDGADAVDDGEPTPVEEADEPAEDVDLAPELTGLTDWRNTDPVSLEDLRGEPVVLVFWNSI